MFCIHCAERCTPADRFCGACGKPLPAASSEAEDPRTTAAVTPPRRSHRIGRAVAAAIVLLVALGVLEYRHFSNDWTYERSFAHRTPAQALFLRAQNGETSKVKALLSDGLSPNTRDPQTGLTALIVAAMGGHLNTVSALLAAGADVNAQDNSGTTALMAAAIRDRVELTLALLAGGANVRIQSNGGLTALTIAQRKGFDALERVLQEAQGR